MPVETFLEKCREAGTHEVGGRLKHLSYGTEETYLPVIRRGRGVRSPLDE